MKGPDWLHAVLENYESRSDPHSEIIVSDSVNAAAKDKPAVEGDERTVLLAEWSAFRFYERPNEDSCRQTYFAPLHVRTRENGSEDRSPDIEYLDATILAYWKRRAHEVTNPAMKARYADLVLDFGWKFGTAKRDAECARLAIDAYLKAAAEGRATQSIEGMQWLQRAIRIASGVHDSDRLRQSVDALIAYDEAVLNTAHVGVWIVPFDALYGRKNLITDEQEQHIVERLEAVLKRLTAHGSSEFDPFGVRSAGRR